MAGDSQLPPTFQRDDNHALGLSEDARPKDSWQPSHRAVQVRGLESNMAESFNKLLLGIRGMPVNAIVQFTFYKLVHAIDFLISNLALSLI